MRRIDTIKFKVCSYYSISMVHMTSTNRSRRFSRPRQIAMYLCRQYTDMSLPAIASEFCKDHTTVLHAIKNINSLKTTNQELRDDLRIIEGGLPFIHDNITTKIEN